VGKKKFKEAFYFLVGNDPAIIVIIFFLLEQSAVEIRRKDQGVIDFFRKMFSWREFLIERFKE